MRRGYNVSGGGVVRSDTGVVWSLTVIDGVIEYDTILVKPLQTLL